VEGLLLARTPFCAFFFPSAHGCSTRACQGTVYGFFPHCLNLGESPFFLLKRTIGYSVELCLSASFLLSKFSEIRLRFDFPTSELTRGLLVLKKLDFDQLKDFPFLFFPQRPPLLSVLPVVIWSHTVSWSPEYASVSRSTSSPAATFRKRLKIF